MRLELKNFRKISSLDLEFVDGEITLLNGSNTIGKSTILNAISWILYGNAKRVCPKSKPKSKVIGKLTVNNITITRTANPGRVELFIAKNNEDDEEQNDKEDQEDNNEELIGKTFVGNDVKAYVEEHFGKQELWYVSSCVENNDINNFLLCTNAQRMNLLNSIAFGNSNPQDRIDRIDKEIKEVKEELSKKSGTLDARKNDFKDIEQEEDNYNEEACRTSEELNEIKSNLKYIRDRLPKLRIEWNKYQQKMGEYSNNIKNKENIDSEIRELQNNKPDKPAGYITSDNIHHNIIKITSNSNIREKIKELKHLTKNVKIFKNDEKLLKDMMKTLAEIELEKSKCDKLNTEYNEESVNNKLDELDEEMKECKLCVKINRFKELNSIISGRYNYLNNLLPIMKQKHRYDELENNMKLADLYMNSLRKEKEYCENILSKYNRHSRDIKKYKQLERKIEQGNNYTIKEKYEKFRDYYDFLQNKKVLEEINEIQDKYPSFKDKSVKKDKNNKYENLTLNVIRKLERKVNKALQELPDIKNKIMRKKYHLKDIKESFENYTCPQCECKFHIDVKTRTAVLSSTTRSYTEEDHIRVQKELEDLKEKQEKLECESKFDLEDMYLQYYLELKDFLGEDYDYESNEQVSKPKGYDEDELDELEELYESIEDEDCLQVDNIKSLVKEYEKLKYKLEELNVDVDNIKIESEDEEETDDDENNEDIDNIKSRLDRVNYILSLSSINLDDVEEEPSDIDIKDINIKILENCKDDMVELDEIEESISELNLNMNIEDIREEIKRIENLKINIDKSQKEVKSITSDVYKEIMDIILEVKLPRLISQDDTFGLKNDIARSYDDIFNDIMTLKSVKFIDYPEYNYEELETSVTARKNIKEMKELKERLEDIDDYEDVDVLKKKYEICKKYEEEINAYNDKMSFLQDKLKQCVESQEPSKPEENIHDMEKELDRLNDELEDARKANHIRKILDTLTEVEEEIEELENELKCLMNIKQIAIDVQCNMLDRLISTLNRNINVLLNKLLDDPITVEIKLYREMKTKKIAKQNVNLLIRSGIDTFDNITDMCSGERSMISIALTLVFNSLSPSPMILFDETFSKLSSEWRDEAIKIIENNSMAKTVICTIHGGVKGYFDNVIDLPCDKVKYVKCD